jgi:thiol peroxidase
MASITLKGQPIQTLGELPQIGELAPNFHLTQADLNDTCLADFAEQKLVLNIFPSIDTGVCAASVREFNKIAAQLDNTQVLCISADLPFAQQRFCAAEGLERVKTLSSFRHPAFGEAYGLTISTGPLRGLLSRAVVIIDANHKICYTEQVPEIAQEPNYQAALDALHGC